MKTNSIYILFGLFILILTLNSCDDDETVLGNETGTFSILFDNVVGDSDIALQTAGSTNYTFTTTSGQNFNISTLGYYISKIKLEGPNGELFEDEMKASAFETTGYYHVKETVPTSTAITLENVPAGTYNKVSFTLGVEEDGVAQGAAAGVLDPAEGAWFWNWNAGYVAFKLEGTAEDSPEVGNGVSTVDNGYGFHVGGWKDVPADSTGGNLTFVNNIKHFSFDFGSDITVNESLEPNAHIVMDVKQLLEDAAIDFETQYSFHSPIKGKVIADQFNGAFTLDHVHQ